MYKFLIVALLAATAVPSAHSDDLIGRPYKSFDSTAYCRYTSYHPAQYLTDNNWDILCAFRQPGTVGRLDSLSISANKSQLLLLEVGGLLNNDNGVYSTAIHIFDRQQTVAIRTEAREFADSIFPIIRPDIERLKGEFERAGFSPQAYSLIFSYLLDGYIWHHGLLPASEEMTDYGSWSGAFWVMYDHARASKTGTNTYGGSVKVNWSDDLHWSPGAMRLFRLAQATAKTGGTMVEDPEMAAQLAQWGLTDQEGRILVPVITEGSGDSIDTLCRDICVSIADAVRSHSSLFMTHYNIADRHEAEVILYHEVLWYLLDACEESGIITKPDILKADNEAPKTDFARITFIVLPNE